MKINLSSLLVVGTLAGSMLVAGGCGDPVPDSEAANKKLDEMAPEARFEWLKKAGGMSVIQKQMQVDAIKGATEEQKKKWKEELAAAGGGAMPGATPPIAK